MTAGVARAEPASATDAPPASLIDLLAWGACTVMLLIYSQAWLVPIFGDNVDPQASDAVRALYIPAYSSGVFLLALKPGAFFASLIRQPFLILLLGVVVASITWSVAPDQTIRRAVALGFTTASGVALGARWRWPGFAEALATTFAILTVSSLIAGAFIPSIGRMTTLFPGAWRGLWQEKNIFGGEMAMAVPLFVAAGILRPERRWLWFSLAGLAFLLILASTSKTALVSLVMAAGGFGLVLVVRRGGTGAVAAIYAAVLGLVALGAGLLLAPDVFLNLLGKDATLTGRTKIWAAVMRQIQLRPEYGYGYGAVWTEEDNWGPLAWIIKQAGFRPNHAHNSWLEQWLGMGYWGLGAWTLYYLNTVVRAIIAMFRSPGALVAVPFLIIYTLTTLTESVAVSYNDMRWVIFIAISVRLALPEEDRIKPPEAGARLPRR